MASRLLVSFSGGETSALMAKLCLERLRDEYDEVRTVFANTGQENEETLQFVKRCDEEFGLGVVWIEADPARGSGKPPRVVSFETASRSGQPFEAVIREYGVPGPQYGHCSRELKGRPIRRWAQENGWSTGSYDLAIGIRVDEIDRMSPSAKAERIIYPLVSRFPHTKPKVNEFWRRQSFRLQLKGYQGNCKWCWKKSLRKLVTIMQETPEAFAFPEEMERLYGAGAEDRHFFFRDHMTVSDIRAMAAERAYAPPSDDARQYQTELPLSYEEDLDACGSESCEVPFGVAA